MACPRCGSEVRAGQKFCAECGLTLSRACPNCGAAYEGNPKFCAECGFGLGGATATPQSPDSTATATHPMAERRYVSVLFADLVGFTQLSEQQDPEDVRELLSGYFDTARQVIEGYGGAVEKFIGDAVMAVWGAPVAREDDAERAVRAALELVDRVRQLSIGGQRLMLRAGVLSGEAAVTPGRVGEGMVAGDLVNTASRLQSVAPSGFVLVGDSTQQATSAAITYEPAGEQMLKGKQAPVAAWRALRVVARIGGQGREEGLEPPFVGRDEELRLLKDQLHAAEREQKLRVVAITGQAGMGKSRLVWELEKYLDGLAGPLYYWHQGRSPSYGEGVTYWALGEMVRRRAGIAEGEDEDTTREKLRATLADFVASPEERRAIEPALAGLLGIAEADWDAREQLFSAWRTFFERIADRGTTIMVFEDLQWADPGLLDFIDHLLDWTRDKPILIVTLARPEFLERRPNFGVGHRAFAAQRLEPLSDEAVAELLRGLVPELSDADLARIVSHAEGVPLFAVETVRSLVDAAHLVRRHDIYVPTGELPTLDIPPTLRALIASRLDTLEPADRKLLQHASVLGLVFSVPALGSLAGKPGEQVEQQLRVLAHKELLVLETDPRSPERGQYRFRQGLIREVTYGTLAKRDRRVLHLAAARHFETLGDEELAGVLANHYLEAYEASPGGEEGAAVAAQARVALRSAAERAFRLHSHEQAVAYYEKAMAVTFDDDDKTELMRLAARSADAAGQVDKSEALLRQAIAGYEQRGDTVRAAETTGLLGSRLLENSRIDEAMELLTRALLGLPVEEIQGTVELKAQLARGHLFRDQPDEALTVVSQALEAVERLDLPELSLQLIITKSWALSSLSRQREASALLMGAYWLADDEDVLWPRIRTRYNAPGYMMGRDPRLSLRFALEGLALAQQYGLSSSVTMQAGNAADAALAIGDLDRVLDLESSVSELNTPMGTLVHGAAAVAAALRGDREGARRRLDLLQHQYAGSDSAQDLMAVRNLEARVAFGAGELREARRLAIESRDAYRGMPALQSALLAGHGAVLLGDVGELRSDLSWFQALPSGGAWMDRSIATLAAAAAALEGRTGEAAAAYRELIEAWRAADLPLDLGLTLLERAWLLGEADPALGKGELEAQAIFAAMGAETLIERLRSGAAQRDKKPSRQPRSRVPVGAQD
jgi:class 3 adenylate cyclase/tetratricopeptide (TPR) repeat protein